MTILKEGDKKINEFLDVKNIDKIRTTGSLSGWQRNVYNLITKKLASTILDKMMQYINKSLPEEADPESTKETIKIALMDYVDSVF